MSTGCARASSLELKPYIRRNALLQFKSLPSKAETYTAAMLFSNKTWYCRATVLASAAWFSNKVRIMPKATKNFGMSQKKLVGAGPRWWRARNVATGKTQAHATKDAEVKITPG